LRFSFYRRTCLYMCIHGYCLNNTREYTCTNMYIYACKNNTREYTCTNMYACKNNTHEYTCTNMYVFAGIVFTGVHVCPCVFASSFYRRTCLFAGIVFTGVHVCTCVFAGIVFTGVHVCTCVKQYPRIHMYKHVRL
jgi:hypothetical protein